MVVNPKGLELHVFVAIIELDTQKHNKEIHCRHCNIDNDNDNDRVNVNDNDAIIDNYNDNDNTVFNKQI